jgi:hypothetical protein
VQLTYHVSLARSVFDFEGLMVLLSAAVKSLLPFLRCLDQGGHSGDFCLFSYCEREARDSLSLMFKDDAIPLLLGS